MKSKPTKLPKKKTVSQLKKQLWKLFSQYIRARDKYICFTCGRKGEGSGMHAGHFVAKSVGGIALYFHEDNVRAQCYNCNINLGGNAYIYGQRLGNKVCKKLYTLKGQIVKDFPYEEKIAEYTEKLKSIGL